MSGKSDSLLVRHFTEVFCDWRLDSLPLIVPSVLGGAFLSKKAPFVIDLSAAFD
jgi:hypothetical protein